MAMFKNKALYVQMVNPEQHKPTLSAGTPTQTEELTEIPKWIDESIKEYGVLALKGALLLMVANTALHTVEQIIVNRTKPDHK